MRFLLITLEYFPFKGGVANYYTNLFHYWPKSSQIFVIHDNDKKLLSKIPFFSWFKSLVKFYHFIRKNKINHVIVGQILPLGIPIFILSYFLKIKYSVVLHGMDFSFSLKSKRKSWISKKILERSTCIICANTYVAKLCANFINDSEKIEIVNPGAKDLLSPDQSFIEKTKNKYKLDNKHVLFSLGRLVKRKGFDMVIKAIKKIKDDQGFDDIIYFIAGEGPDKKYLEELSKSELGPLFSDSIVFLGSINEAEKWSLFSLCDIFIMPSRDIDGDFEGFGIVYLEANLAKKPVIAGNSGGVSDAVSHNYNGLLVDPCNEKEISEAIEKLLLDKSLRDEIGKRGRERVLTEFNWAKQIEKMSSFLIKKTK